MFNPEREQSTVIIEQVEKEWLYILSRHNQEIFKGTWLPSHDHEHHRRVWAIARKLLVFLYNKGYTYDKKFVQKLLFAVLFHDTGMIHTLEKQHGIESRRLCSLFLNEQKVYFAKEDENELLDAIEKHDNKEYQSSMGKNTFTLYHLLTIADDLDAFGAIGVFRYFEIYYHRGLSLDVIPREAKANLLNRFDHFAGIFRDHPALIDEFKPAYLFTLNFFKACIDKNINYLQVMDILKNEVIEHQKPLNEVAREHAFSNEGVVKDFFERVFLQSRIT